MIVALAGRRIDAPGTSPPRFPAANEALVSARLRDALGELGATVIAGSAACGADLVALEVAGSMDLRRCVVLPWDRETFRRRSVVDRGESWGERFDRVVDQVAARGDLTVLDLEYHSDAAYTATNREILSMASDLARAEGREGRPVAVPVWEGWSPGASGFTNEFRTIALELGFRIHEVRTL
jgi:hypothetical protein